MLEYNGDDDRCNDCGSDPCIGSRCPGRTNGFLELNS